MKSKKLITQITFDIIKYSILISLIIGAILSKDSGFTLKTIKDHITYSINCLWYIIPIISIIFILFKNKIYGTIIS